ncbi:MAG: hypothetical protein ACKVUS_07320 [Saprospiraceae bacterium]
MLGWLENGKSINVFGESVTLPVLSAQWWRSPKQEARKLASRLLRAGE